MGEILISKVKESC